MSPDYSQLYEHHAATSDDPAASIGDGDFDSVGRLELSLLVLEGLKPHGSLLDFGCGVGRLALQAIPYLASGRYLGLDISPTMIDGARKFVRERLHGIPSDRYRFDVNDGEDFARGNDPFDMICAYSVFTHMEAEDTYRYLCRFFALLRPGGKVVASVLPLETELARRIFLEEAALSPSDRWKRVRNVATSFPMTECIANMAGFMNFRWYRGNEFGLRHDDRTRTAFGQSVLVAERA